MQCVSLPSCHLAIFGLALPTRRGASSGLLPTPQRLVARHFRHHGLQHFVTIGEVEENEASGKNAMTPSEDVA